MALIGNKFVEHDLRAWLDGGDYYGRSAELEELELAAVQRPGWVQVFRFRVRAKHRGTGEWESLRGLCRDDERVKKKADRTEYRFTPDDAAFDAAFAEWSDGLIKLRVRRDGDPNPAAAYLAFAAAVAALAAAAAGLAAALG